MANTVANRAAESSSAESQSPWLTTAEACLLARCCRRTLSRWIADGLVDSSRPVAAGSGRRLIDRASLLAFLQGETVTA